MRKRRLRGKGKGVRSHVLRVRVTEQTRRQVEAASEACSIDISYWLDQAIKEKLRRYIQKPSN